MNQAKRIKGVTLVSGHQAKNKRSQKEKAVSLIFFFPTFAQRRKTRNKKRKKQKRSKRSKYKFFFKKKKYERRIGFIGFGLC